MVNVNMPVQRSPLGRQEERMTNEQGWKETLEDLDLRRERSRAMGGPNRLAKHRGKGKLDARAPRAPS
jgi:hypothetical protein